MENIIVLESEAQEIFSDGVVQYETTETVVLDGIKMYLKSIGNHPRLTFEEEKELSVRALNVTFCLLYLWLKNIMAAGFHYLILFRKAISV